MKVIEEMLHKACDIYDANCVYKNVGIDSVAMKLALQAALDAMPKQEPVCFIAKNCIKWLQEGKPSNCVLTTKNHRIVGTQLVPLYTHPQPQREPLKDHEVAKIVNEITDIAKEFNQSQQLRERVRKILLPHLKPQCEPLSEEEVLSLALKHTSENHEGFTVFDCYKFASEIEKAHGIGVDNEC